MIYPLLSTPNASSYQSHQQESQISQTDEVVFWTATAVSTLIVIFGTIANSLVLYFANKESLTGRPLRHLNTVVKHLAVADLLYGVLACPLFYAYWKMGKSKP